MDLPVEMKSNYVMIALQILKLVASQQSLLKGTVRFGHHSSEFLQKGPGNIHCLLCCSAGVGESSPMAGDTPGSTKD